MIRNFWVILAFLIPIAATAQNSGGLQTAVSIDTLGRFGDPYEGDPNKIEVREAEVIFFAPIDSIWDGALNLAAHQETGQSFFEVHEAYLSTSKWIPRTRVRIGQYFLGIGRLNSFHRHDWPFVSAPRVQREFFDEEGINDTGLEWSTLLPGDSFWEATFGIASGWNFGHAHTLGSQPKIPLVYGKLTSFSEIGETGGAQYGLNWLLREDSDRVRTQLIGLDVTAKWREARTLLGLIQGEVWLREISSSQTSNTEWSLGSYLFLQYGYDSQWNMGIRLESIGNLSLSDSQGNEIPNTEYSIVPTLTFKNSEFATFRAAYTLGFDRSPGEAFQTRQSLELQATFILGAHPAHDF